MKYTSYILYTWHNHALVNYNLYSNLTTLLVYCTINKILLMVENFQTQPTVRGNLVKLSYTNIVRRQL